MAILHNLLLPPAVAEVSVPPPPGLSPSPVSQVSLPRSLPLTSVNPLLPVEDVLDAFKTTQSLSEDALLPPPSPTASPPDLSSSSFCGGSAFSLHAV